jgi:hypothetical protein
VRKVGIAIQATARQGSIQFPSAPWIKFLSISLWKTMIWSNEKKRTKSETSEKRFLYFSVISAAAQAAIHARFSDTNGSHAAGIPLEAASVTTSALKIARGIKLNSVNKTTAGLKPMNVSN